MVYVVNKADRLSQTQVYGLLGIELAASILWGLSANYGYERASACREARAAAAAADQSRPRVTHRQSPRPAPRLPAPEVAPGDADIAKPASSAAPPRAPAPQQHDDDVPGAPRPQPMNQPPPYW